MKALIMKYIKIHTIKTIFNNIKDKIINIIINNNFIIIYDNLLK